MRDSFVQVSQTAISSVRHCKHIGLSLTSNSEHGYTERHPIDSLGPVGHLREMGESAAVGQVAMATDHGGRRTARTGGVGCSIGEPPSGLREDTKGHGQAACCPRRRWRSAKEREANGAELHRQIAVQNTA